MKNLGIAEEKQFPEPFTSITNPLYKLHQTRSKHHCVNLSRTKLYATQNKSRMENKLSITHVIFDIDGLLLGKLNSIHVSFMFTISI